jgi:hypothetical protein
MEYSCTVGTRNLYVEFNLSDTPMNYPSGEKVVIGDRVRLWRGCEGTVVCSIDDGQYTPAFPKSEWEYLKRGVLIESGQAGLIHYIQPEDSFELIARSSAT